MKRLLIWIWELVAIPALVGIPLLGFALACKPSGPPKQLDPEEHKPVKVYKLMRTDRASWEVGFLYEVEHNGVRLLCVATSAFNEAGIDCERIDQ